MWRHGRRFAVIVVLVVGWELGLRPVVLSSLAASQPQAGAPNAELVRLYTEDQADRQPAAGRSIDWVEVGTRDKARLARVRELYTRAELRAGEDYWHAAMVLQHGGEPSDYLLAHELCVVAIGKGFAGAKWLAAASEDRFLGSVGRSQRFGTQYNSAGPNAPFRLAPVEDGVTDALRREFDTPTLDEAKAREAEMNK
jgi:hypothetical protein